GGAAGRASVRQVDLHAAGTGIVRNVEAGAAAEQIGAQSTVKRIVPVVPEQAIVAGLAVDNIVVAAPPERVAESGSGNPFNSGERVALGMAAAAGTGLQVDQDWSVGSAIIGEVEACAAVDQVAAAASGNDV